FAGRRDRLPEAPEGSAWFAAPGHAVFDLYAHVELAPGATLDLGLLNLGDRRYWTAGALPLAPGRTTTLDRYTAPGRSLAFNLALAWRFPARPASTPTGARHAPAQPLPHPAARRPPVPRPRLVIPRPARLDSNGSTP